MNLILRNIWHFQKTFCVEAYTDGDYAYYNNMIDIPNEHHHNFILNQIQYMYVSSPLKFMDEIFE